MFCRALESSSLKRAGVQYDPQSGGPRTYFSQLKCIGLIFERPDRSIHLTIAGDDLAKGSPPLPIMQSMLLRHQYPSIYGNLQNVKMNPSIKVKPFLFILELLKNVNIKFLRNEEMAIPVLYGHNRSCLPFCAEKILEMRTGKKLKDMIDHENDLYLPRSNVDKDKKIKNVLDIANTCKNYLQGCCLITVEQEGRNQIIKFNDDIEPMYIAALGSTERFIPVRAEEESFQRAYGAWNRLKDTRTIDKEEARVLRPEESIILSAFYHKCGESVVSELPQQFIKETVAGYGFSRDIVEEIIYPHLDRALDFFESTFLSLSTGGARTATKFEKAISALFSDKLHFDSTHTGQMRRSDRGSGFADVFVVALDNKHCAIIDGKASPNYALPSGDYRAMTYDYIPNYTKLANDRPLILEFASFIAGGYSGNVSEGLQRIKQESGVSCSAIKAKDLLEISKKYPNERDQEKVRSIFRNNNIISSQDI
jgi:hypothetical protein